VSSAVFIERWKEREETDPLSVQGASLHLAWWWVGRKEGLYMSERKEIQGKQRKAFEVVLPLSQRRRRPFRYITKTGKKKNLTPPTQNSKTSTFMLFLFCISLSLESTFLIMFLFRLSSAGGGLLDNI